MFYNIDHDIEDNDYNNNNTNKKYNDNSNV